MARNNTMTTPAFIRAPSMTRDANDLSRFPTGAQVQFQEKFSTLSTPQQLERILLKNGFDGSRGVYHHADVYLQRVDQSSANPTGRTYFTLEMYVSATQMTTSHPLRRALRELCEATPVGIASKDQVEAYLGIRRD